MRLCSLVLALILSFPLSADAQKKPTDSKDGEITLDRILNGEFNETGFAPSGDWLPDGKSLVTTEGRSDIVKIDAVTGKSTVLIPGTRLIPKGSSRPLNIEHFTVSEDGFQLLIFTNSSRVWRRNTRGDYWVYSVKSGRLMQLGAKFPASSLMFAKLSPDGAKAGYVYANNIYIQDLASGQITQLTPDGTETLINGTFDWVYEEELDLRDGWRWSPDSKKIAYFQVDSSKEPIMTLINDTDTLYPTIKQYPYPKAGETNPTVRIGVVPADGGTTVWVDNIATTTNGYIARMDWADNSSELLFEKLNRAQNKNEYMIADAGTGYSRMVYTDEDAAWVDILDTGANGAEWISDGKAFLIFSEHSGWRHLYSISRDGSEVHDITPGDFDVDEFAGIDESLGRLYFTASPTDSTQRYLYKSEVSNPNPQRLTPNSEAGTNSYQVSPDGTLAFHTHSSYGVPSERELVTLPAHTQVRLFGENSGLKAKLKTLNLGPAAIVRLKADDGEAMDASLILPPNFDPKKKYPLFFSVYGEPAGTTVHDSWDGFGYMFDQMLAQKGYIVASVDNRGTPTLKGRAWRKSVYKKIGIVASADQAAAAKQISSLPYVDADRIGIWGWSGGGSMTLNMLFRYPDIYKLGMSVAPVPDTRLYDTIYQERYMGTPEADPEVFRQCSPITFAKNLKGALLIVHGSGDDNVHYQGTERLINELVAHEKPFQLMVYPNRTHSISEGPGTTRHLYDLLVRFLTTNMPPGPKL